VFDSHVIYIFVLCINWLFSPKFAVVVYINAFTCFFVKDPSSRPSSNSSLFLDLLLSNSSSESSLIASYFHCTYSAVKVVHTLVNTKILNFAINLG